MSLKLKSFLGKGAFNEIYSIEGDSTKIVRVLRQSLAHSWRMHTTGVELEGYFDVSSSFQKHDIPHAKPHSVEWINHPKNTSIYVPALVLDYIPGTALKVKPGHNSPLGCLEERLIDLGFTDIVDFEAICSKDSKYYVIDYGHFTGPTDF